MRQHWTLSQAGSEGAPDRAQTRVNTGPLPRPWHFLPQDLVMGGSDLTWGSRAVFGGPSCAHRGPVPSLRRSGPDDAVSQNTTSTAHEISLGLFSAWLGIAAQASCLHTVVRSTPNLGCQQVSYCFDKSWPVGINAILKVISEVVRMTVYCVIHWWYSTACHGVKYR